MVFPQYLDILNQILAADIPTAESLQLTSTAGAGSSVPLPHAINTESVLKRDEWMLMPTSAPVMPAHESHEKSLPLSSTNDSFTEDYGEPSGDSRTTSGGVDFFSSLGTQRNKNPKPEKPNPDMVCFALFLIYVTLVTMISKPFISSRELNQDLKEGRPVNFDEPPTPPPSFTPGGPGSQWRMMRLRRVYEAAEEEGRSVEEVGTDRFGSLEAFEEARKERKILDEREGRRGDRERERGRGTDRPSHFSKDGEKRLMFTDVGGSGGSSRSSSFRRPGGMPESNPSTPSPPSGMARTPANKRLDSLRLPSQMGSPLAQSHTPIPSVMTPATSGSRSRALSPSSLNKLQAKVLRAKLMGTPDAEKLEQEYEAEARKVHGAEEGGVRTKVEVLPTLDARGRMYDVGHGKDDGQVLAGNRKKKTNVRFSYHCACLHAVTDSISSSRHTIVKPAKLFESMQTMTH